MNKLETKTKIIQITQRVKNIVDDQKERTQELSLIDCKLILIIINTDQLITCSSSKRQIMPRHMK